MDYVLIGIRAVHFVSTVLVGGILFFRLLVADPALRQTAGERLPGVDVLYAWSARLLWFNLVIALLSGAAWLLAVSAGIAGLHWREAFSDGVTWIVLTETRFGHAWMARLIIAGAIAAGASFLGHGNAQDPRWWRWVSGLLAVGFLAALALSGHAGATPGLQGELHLASDILHLVAVGTWLGGLLPLALLLVIAGRSDDRAWADVAVAATRRFSTLGMASVATLVMTGIINSWNLIDGASALVTTDYGRLLLLKVGIFLAMMCIAAVNLRRLTPRLPDRGAMRQLRRNSLVETGLGIVVLVIVAALGTMSPAMQVSGHVH